MDIEETIFEAKQFAEGAAISLGLALTSSSLKVIEDAIVRNEEAIEESLITKKKFLLDLKIGVRRLIDEASFIAREEDRTTIHSSDIRGAMPRVCPNYWPFC